VRSLRADVARCRRQERLRVRRPRSDKRIHVNADAGLGETNLELRDQAVEACPVGAILKKRVGFAVPVGQRKYDHEPIGTEIETSKPGV
jgi:[NiFe] hydrogenase diaphorase moiety small subunit